MLGTKIREIRKQKGMTVNELAEKTQFTASYISQLERNIVDPSISSLRKISIILEVPIYTFLEENDRQHIIITRDKRQKLELPNSSIVYEFLTPMAANKEINAKMEIIYFELEPKSWTSDEYLTHEADECIFVTRGQIEVYLGEENYHLMEGDSIYIVENTPHKMYNPTDEKVTGFSNICPPIY